MTIETLEARTLFTVAPTGSLLPLPPLPPITINLNDTRVTKVGRELRVEGGLDGDPIAVQQIGLYLKVSTDVGVRTFLRADVDLVRVNGNSGDDAISCAGGVTVRLIVNGGAGNDVVGGGEANDDLSGGDGNDRFLSSRGADVYRGGTGLDALDRPSEPAGLNISLDGLANDGLAGEGDNVMPDVEELRGSSWADVFTAGVTAARFFGNGGADSLLGGPSNDLLDGGVGDDFLDGKGGNDNMYGAGGNDVARGGAGTDTFNADGTGVTTGSLIVALGGRPATGFRPHVDRLPGGDVELILGTRYADDVRGGTANELILGMGGDDTLRGGPGNDSVFAGDGADLVYGDAGNDYLRGDAGNDVLIAVGGGTADRVDGGAGDDVIWADDDATESVSVASATERAKHFVNRVAAYNNGAGLEPTGGAIADPGFTSAAARYASFANSPIFARPASIKDINQQLLGNCWWMAAAGGVAQKNPDYLRGVVVPLGDSTFGVRLGAQFYRIDADLPVNADGNLVYAGLALGGGIWVALAEKAMVLHRATGLPHNNNQYGRLELGSAGEGFSNFGFHEQGKRYPWLDPADLDDDYNWARSQLDIGRAVTFTTGAVFGDSPLIAGHVYNLVDAFASGGQRYMTFRNPWGKDHNNLGHVQGANDGYITLRYADVNSSVLEWVSCVTSL